MSMINRAAAFSFVLIFLSFFSFSSAGANPTATPQPLPIVSEPSEPPEIIQSMIDVARAEWKSINGKKLRRSNKYTRTMRVDCILLKPHEDKTMSNN